MKKEKLEIVIETVEDGSYQEYYSRQATSLKDINRLFKTFKAAPRLLKELESLLPHLNQKQKTLIKKLKGDA